MNEAIISEGKCLYCDQLISQKEMGKHLAKHLDSNEGSTAVENRQTFCHVEVEANEMFLHLLVKGDATMNKIDKYLRGIWLECCGHMSEFGHKSSKVAMGQKVQDVFVPRIKIHHDYDFGTTTRVFLKGLKHYQLNLKESLVLMSRNEPLNLMCATCKTEPAVNLCATYNWEKYSFFCKKCSKKHEKVCDDFADYSCMPVVNSPRMGQCGYTGGTIDKARDGVYRKTE